MGMTQADTAPAAQHEFFAPQPDFRFISGEDIAPVEAEIDEAKAKINWNWNQWNEHEVE